MSAELYDKLILRILFSFFLILMLYIYKYFHKFLYPSSRNQMFREFDPHHNPADTLHYFSRLAGIAIIFSEFSFNISNSIWLAMLDFFIQSSAVYFLFLGAIYILEGIILYNFEYQDEVMKKSNFSYAIICMAQTIALSFLMKIIFSVSKGSLVLLFFLWLFSLVIIGFAARTFPLISQLPFNKGILQKDIGVALSYLGFFTGWTIIITNSLNSDLHNLGLSSYSIQVVLKIALSLIILPIFRKGLNFIFNIKESKKKISYTQKMAIGPGLYEGVFFFSACLLTSVITGNINFGSFYPVF